MLSLDKLITIFQTTTIARKIEVLVEGILKSKSNGPESDPELEREIERWVYKLEIGIVGKIR